MVRKIKPTKSYGTKKRFKYTKPAIGVAPRMSMSKGIGNRVHSNFIYFGQVSIDSGVAGITDNHVFSLNSLYDPDTTGVGHQPGAFDQLMAIYEHYCVTEVEYKIMAFNTNGSNVAALLSIQLSDNLTTDANIGTIIENGNSQWSGISSATGGKNPIIMTGTVDVSKLMGVSKAQLLADDTFWGSAGTSPSDPCYLKISTTGFANQTDGPSVDVAIELRYKAVLMGGRFVTQS